MRVLCTIVLYDCFVCWRQSHLHLRHRLLDALSSPVRCCLNHPDLHLIESTDGPWALGSTIMPCSPALRMCLRAILRDARRVIEDKRDGRVLDLGWIHVPVWQKPGMATGKRRVPSGRSGEGDPERQLQLPREDPSLRGQRSLNRLAGHHGHHAVARVSS